MHPILFHAGSFPVPAYGFLIAVALVIGWILSLRLARADKLPVDELGMAYIASVASGLLAARVMWMTQHPDPSRGLAAVLQLEAGGLAGFGGVLTGLIIAGVYCQNKKIPPWAWLDCAAPAFLLGVALERTGAFLAGAEVGHYVDPSTFIAIQYPADSPVYALQLRELAGLRLPTDQSLPVHPTQLYGAAAALLGFAGSFLVRARRRYSGQVALFAMGFFGVVRYLVEDPFRYDKTPEIAGPVTLGHVAGVAIVAIVAIAHTLRLQKLAQDPAAGRQWTGGPWTPGAEDSADGKSKKKSGKKKSAKKSSGKKKSGKKSSGKKSSGKKSSGKKTSAKKKSAKKKPSGEAKADD